jgi:hypothetical protein
VYEVSIISVPVSSLTFLKHKEDISVGCFVTVFLVFFILFLSKFFKQGI